MWQKCKKGFFNDEHLFVNNTLRWIPIITLSRHQAELYYLHMLLHHKCGRTTYEGLRMINGDVCRTFQAACVQLGLLKEDEEKNRDMEEASSIQLGPQLLEMFAAFLLYCCPADPLVFWENWKGKMARDIMYQRHDTTMSEFTMHTVLLKLQERVENGGLDLHFDLGLPLPDPTIVMQAQIHNVIREEMLYDFDEERIIVHEKLPTLNLEQREVCNK